MNIDKFVKLNTTQGYRLSSAEVNEILRYINSITNKGDNEVVWDKEHVDDSRKKDKYSLYDFLDSTYYSFFPSKKPEDYTQKCEDVDEKAFNISTSREYEKNLREELKDFLQEFSDVQYPLKTLLASDGSLLEEENPIYSDYDKIDTFMFGIMDNIDYTDGIAGATTEEIANVMCMFKCLENLRKKESIVANYRFFILQNIKKDLGSRMENGYTISPESKVSDQMHKIPLKKLVEYKKYKQSLEVLSRPVESEIKSWVKFIDSFPPIFKKRIGYVRDGKTFGFKAIAKKLDERKTLGNDLGSILNPESQKGKGLEQEKRYE